MIQTINFDEDPLKIQKAWERAFSRVQSIHESAKLKAIEACGSDTERIKVVESEWNDLTDSAMKISYEVKEIIENLRKTRVDEVVPEKINNLTVEVKNLWIKFLETPADYNSFKDFWTYTQNFFRQQNQNLIQEVASTQ